MQFYEKFQRERNDLRAKPETQRKYVIEWHEKKIETARMHWSKNVRKYARQCKINREDRSTDYMKWWLIGLSMLKKREKKINGNKNDMRQYITQDDDM